MGRQAHIDVHAGMAGYLYSYAYRSLIRVEGSLPVWLFPFRLTFDITQRIEIYGGRN